MKFLTILLFAAATCLAETSIWEKPMSEFSANAEAGDPRVRQDMERDSVPVYNALIEKYERRHAKLSGLGNLFLFSGGLLLGSGLCIMASREEADDLFLTGFYMALFSSYPITAGIVLKAVGGKQGRNAKRFREKKEFYEAKRAYRFSVSPTFNPVSRAPGAALSLSF